MQLRAELHQAQLERDFFKKLRAVSKNKQLPQKRKWFIRYGKTINRLNFLKLLI